jgi:hypothetical protein
MKYSYDEMSLLGIGIGAAYGWSIAPKSEDPLQWFAEVLARVVVWGLVGWMASTSLDPSASGERYSVLGATVSFSWSHWDPR